MRGDDPTEGDLVAIDRQQARLEMDLDGKITAVNDRFCAMLGRSRDDLMGTSGRGMIDSVDHPDADIWAQAENGPLTSSPARNRLR